MLLKKSGKIISQNKNVSEGELIDVQLGSGFLEAEVKSRRD